MLGRAAIVFLAAALFEVAGCFAFFAVFRSGADRLWLVAGMIALAVFALLLTLSPAETAGRSFAAYGGVYILASLAWLWSVEGVRPDRFDLVGAAMALAGAAIILFGPRAA